MKNNKLVSLYHWKKRNQRCETHDKPDSFNTETSKRKFIMPTEIDEQFNIELEEDCLSGMVIW